MKKKSETNQKLSSGYKYRLASFLEKMVEEPIKPRDDYQEKFLSARQNESLVLSDHECHKPKFRFKSVKTDEDIKNQFREVTSMIDTTPNVPVYKAWDMRARNKSKDVGPEFKHAAKTQLNWINDNIKRQTLSYFK